jgi:hypothetical protein
VSRSTVIIVAAVLIAACSSGGGRRGATPRESTSTTTPPAATIAWAQLRNPIRSDPQHAVKDPALIRLGSEWVLLYSQVDQADTWRIGIARSRDLTSWNDVTTLPHDPATEGEASPDVVRAPDGSYVVTYQSFRHDRGRDEAKLYAVTTSDFRAFSAPIRLAPTNRQAAGDRVIDAALVWTPAGLLLAYKLGNTTTDRQHFELARSTTGTLAGSWEPVGRPNIDVYGDTVENYQFLTIDGRHSLLATSNTFNRPQWFELNGDPAMPTGWLDWKPARELKIPPERWNRGRGLTGTTYEHANCAFVVDGQRIDGYVYLVYADAPDLTSFGEQGHAALAVARSTDLVHWSVPPR